MENFDRRNLISRLRLADTDKTANLIIKAKLTTQIEARKDGDPSVGNIPDSLSGKCD
jgi:hypothetical protein